MGPTQRGDVGQEFRRAVEAILPARHDGLGVPEGPFVHARSDGPG